MFSHPAGYDSSMRRIILKLAGIYHIFPEQFTVKAHPALFEGEVEGEGEGTKK